MNSSQLGHESLATPTDEGWQRIPLSTNAERLFGDLHERDDIVFVGQGKQEVSAGDPLVSTRFDQCSARILVNTVDGSASVCHVGPRSVLDDIEDIGSQRIYTDFMDHAVDTNAGILAVNVVGSTGGYRLRVKNHEEVRMTELPVIPVPASEQSKWSMAFLPESSVVVTQVTRNYSEPTYEAFQLPKANFDQGAESRGKLVDTVNKRKTLMKSLDRLGRTPMVSLEYLDSDAAREGIAAAADLIPELYEHELDFLTKRWQKLFVQKASIPKSSPKELQPSIEALDILFDTRAISNDQDNQALNKIYGTGIFVGTTLIKLKDAGGNALRTAGPLLVDYHDSQIKLAGEQDDNVGDHENALYEYALEMQQFCKKFMSKHQYQRSRQGIRS